MSMLLGGMNVVGDDDDVVVLGASPHHAAIRRHNGHRVPTPAWMNAATSQGVSRPQEELDFLPFDPVTINPGETQGILLARPQRPFRGERLILGAIDGTDGTDQSFNATINPAIYVGAVQIGAAQGAVPFGAFKAEAFGVRLSWPAAGQGTDIKIFCQLLVTPAAEHSVILTATIIGRAMR
jgi:hypothetical protein